MGVGVLVRTTPRPFAHTAPIAPRSDHRDASEQLVRGHSMVAHGRSPLQQWQQGEGLMCHGQAPAHRAHPQHQTRARTQPTPHPSTQHTRV